MLSIDNIYTINQINNKQVKNYLHNIPQFKLKPFIKIIEKTFDINIPYQRPEIKSIKSAISFEFYGKW